MNKPTVAAIGLVLIAALSGCAAVETAVKKRNLDVRTQMSDTVWLDPVGAELHTVFVQIRNTTDKDIDIAAPLRRKLAAKGYAVVGDPGAAHYWLQANILRLERMNLRDARGILASGYGSAATGGALGALAAAAASSDGRHVAAGGLLGAAAGFLADAMVEDVNYAMITDVQIVEKTSGAVRTTEQADIKNGSSGTTKTTLTATDHKKRYTTRVLSNANRVNLEFADARPALIEGLAASISGLF